MRRFDARRQLDGESIPEFESAIRSLHREAWPNATHAQRDSDLKRKFEYGVSHPDLLSHLQIHARYDNFENTVLKARHCIDAHEIARAPKKSVRIITPQPIDHDDVSTDENPAFLQPLLQGFRDVMREHFPPASVNTVNRDPSPGANNSRDENNRNHDRIIGRTAAMEVRIDGTVLSPLPMAITVHSGIPVLTQGHLSTPGPLITPGLSLRQRMDASLLALIAISSGHRRLDHIEDSLSHISLSPIDLSHLDPVTSLDLRLHHVGMTGDPIPLLLSPGTPPAGYNTPHQYYNSGYQANSRYQPSTPNQPTYRRRFKPGCFTCGTYGCHSRFHEPRTEDNATPASRPPSTSNPLLADTVPPLVAPVAQGNNQWVRRSGDPGPNA